MASFGIASFEDTLTGAAAAAAPAAAVALKTKIAGMTATSSKAMTHVAIAGNAFAFLGLLIPIMTFVVPVWKAKNVQGRSALGFLSMLLGCAAWITFAIPSMPGSLPVLVVNGIGIVMQAAYLALFLWFAGAVVRRRTIKQLIFVVALSALLAVLMVVLVLVTKVCKPKVFGVVAATYSTGMFVLAMVMDIVNVVKNRPGQQHQLQLAGNLVSSGIWTGYGFISTPRNYYVLVPNITGIVATMLQFTVRMAIYLQDRNRNRGRPAAPASSSSSAAAAAAAAVIPAAA